MMKEKEKNKIQLDEIEILQVENFDLKQQILNLSQKNIQNEIQKIQNENDILIATMNSFFLKLANKYNLDPDKYVVNLASKCFEEKIDDSR